MKTSTQTFDPDKLRQLMRAWTSGVTVVTAAHGDERHGMTVSSFTSVSLDPPLVVVSLQTGSRTHRLVQSAGAFAVSILGADQQSLSELFSGRVPDDGSDPPDRLAGLETETLVTGAPALKAGLARMDCRVTQAIPAGMNTVFLAEVVAVSGESAGQPLVYHNRGYWTLSKTL
jgi:flavin reductase (DIM6/NTAB) family NADH-FMN oxidoreductase RutF